MNGPRGGRARHEEGSVWLPLMLPSEVAGLELVEAVTSQVEEIIAVTTKSPV